MSDRHGISNISAMTPGDLSPITHTNSATDSTLQLVTEAACIRDGRTRLPTPDKNKIIALSCGFGKKKLGKQQPLLQDIAHKCREQEVTDLSGVSVRKCKLSTVDKKGISFYNSTTSMKTKPTAAYKDSPALSSHASIGGSECDELGLDSRGRPLFERSYTFFPPRRVLKSPEKHYYNVSGCFLPKLPLPFSQRPPSKRPFENGIVKNTNVFGSLKSTTARPFYSQGTLKTNARPFASYRYDGMEDQLDCYMSARGMHIGPRNRSALVSIG